MSDEEKLFSLAEAERLRARLEPVLVETMESRRKLSDLEEKLGDLATRISRSGGMLVSYDDAAQLRVQHDRQEEIVRDLLDRIHSTGCIVKDLDIGLLDFPARMNGEDVYLCWRLGEDRIRFYHRQDEGFSGRKPIDPMDVSPGGPVH